jgi:hypothetical protein
MEAESARVEDLKELEQKASARGKLTLKVSE